MADWFRAESILEPALPIIDPHHHLWHWPGAVLAEMPPPNHAFETIRRNAARYLLDELLADTHSGHNIRATVFVECRSMYRATGPDQLKPVGETEFVNGVAAMSASGIFGETQVCAGIVGGCDLRLGAGVVEVLEAHKAAGGGRFRGIRQSASFDSDARVLGPIARMESGLYLRPDFREGFAQLAPQGLSFDAWLLEPQLPDLIDLAKAFPDTQIVLDHVGTPLGIASYSGRMDERFEAWRGNIAALAALPNMHVKLGGLAMPFCNFPSFMQSPAATSKQLAEEWRPYIETCIEAFGPERCMFESNFPVDSGSCSYATLWNTFKRLTTGASEDEKAALFSGTAARFYRLDT